MVSAGEDTGWIGDRCNGDIGVNAEEEVGLIDKIHLSSWQTMIKCLKAF